MTTLGARAFGAFETRQSLTEPQIDGIARELLAQLSLEEKFGMMSGDTPFFQGDLVAAGKPGRWYGLSSLRRPSWPGLR